MVSLSVCIGIVVMIFLLFGFVIAIQTKELSALHKKNMKLVDKYEKQIADLNNIIFKLRSDLELSRRHCDRKDYSKMRNHKLPQLVNASSFKTKTGRHFPLIKEVLEQIKGEVDGKRNNN